MVSWDTPWGEGPVAQAGFTVAGEDWILGLVRHWAYVIAWKQQAEHDGIFRDRWTFLLSRFDAGSEPQSPAEANGKFRELVGGLWLALDGYEQRRQKSEAAAFFRRLTKIGIAPPLVVGEES